MIVIVYFDACVDEIGEEELHPEGKDTNHVVDIVVDARDEDDRLLPLHLSDDDLRRLFRTHHVDQTCGLEHN